MSFLLKVVFIFHEKSFRFPNFLHFIYERNSYIYIYIGSCLYPNVIYFKVKITFKRIDITSKLDIAFTLCKEKVESNFTIYFFLRAFALLSRLGLVAQEELNYPRLLRFLYVCVCALVYKKYNANHL